MPIPTVFSKKNMPKQIYIPTEEELMDMGFKQASESRYAIRDLGTCGKIHYSSYGKYFRTTMGKIYPRSKQALLDFISNFSPNA